MTRRERCVLPLQSALSHAEGRRQVLRLVTGGILPASAVGFGLNLDHCSEQKPQRCSRSVECQGDVQGMQNLTVPFKFPDLCCLTLLNYILKSLYFI